MEFNNKAIQCLNKGASKYEKGEKIGVAQFIVLTMETHRKSGWWKAKGREQPEGWLKHQRMKLFQPETDPGEPHTYIKHWHPHQARNQRRETYDSLSRLAFSALLVFARHTLYHTLFKKKKRLYLGLVELVVLGSSVCRARQFVLFLPYLFLSCSVLIRCNVGGPGSWILPRSYRCLARTHTPLRYVRYVSPYFSLG